MFSSSSNLNFKISDISLAGDKKVNYLIKNKLLMASDNENKNLIQLKISTKKLKSIKMNKETLLWKVWSQKLNILI